MNKTMIALGLAAMAAMPALAMQQGTAATQQASPQASGKAVVRAPTRPRELVLFQYVNYGGDGYPIEQPRASVRTEWNIRSVGVHPGDRWQICARTRFRDPCIILDRSVPDATIIGIEGQIGSARHETDIPGPD